MGMEGKGDVRILRHYVPQNDNGGNGGTLTRLVVIWIDISPSPLRLRSGQALVLSHKGRGNGGG